MSTSAQSPPEKDSGSVRRFASPSTPARELEDRLIAPVVNKTEIARLPGLPILIDHALKASRGSPDPRAICDWLVLDPTLVARVLEATADAREGRAEVEFRSIEKRVAALDPGLVKSLLIHAASCSLGAERQPLSARELGGFWMHSMRCASLSRALAETCSYRDPEEAYLVGLLHDLGSFALLTAVPNTFRSLVADQAMADEGLPEHAGRLGTIHAQIGAALLEKLRLPFYAVDAVLLHHAPRQELDGTHMLVRILRSAETLAHPRVPVEQLRAVGELLGITAADISGAEKAAAEQMSSVLQSLGLARPQPGAAAAADASPAVPVVDLQRLSDTLVLRFVKEAERPPGEEPAPSGRPGGEEAAASGGAREGAPPGWADALQSASGTVSSLLGQVVSEATRLEAEAVLRSAHDVQSAVSAILPLSGVVTGLRRAALFVAGEGAGNWPGWVVDAEGAARFDLELSTAVSRSLVARAARESNAVTSYVEGRTRKLAGMDLQIARILDADEIAALPLLGDEPGCRGVVVFGTSALKAARLAESLPFLGDVVRLVARALPRPGPGPSADRPADPAEQLRAATRRLVHEARNPLSVLKTYLEIAKTRAGDGEGLGGELAVASREVDRVAKLLDEIGRSGARGLPRTGLVDVNRTIKDLLLVYGAALFGSKGIVVSPLLDPRVAAIACDEEGLKQVLLNLLKNASEALPRGGQVLVSTTDRVNYQGQMMVEISVADNGPGIAPEKIAELFAAPASSARADGRGVGLPTSLAIVQAAGGHLVCRSRPDSGATFTVLLPRGADAGAPASLHPDD
ncbi:MAG TPA: HDOD domain-containing protein [Burkholderiales bacterium]|nr:HDOD domain-containing protein [Burkholderiales bacterium]